MIRAGYGAEGIYSQWATSAWHDWEYLSNATGQSLIARTGALFLAPPDNRYITDTHATLTELRIAVDLIDASELPSRFPQISGDGLGTALFERHAGVIRARRAVRVLVDRLVQSGTTYLLQHVLPLDEQRSTCAVRTASGTVLDADAVVFACGPWLPRLLPQAVGSRLRATRQEVLYFGVPAGDRRFSAPLLPVWIDFSAGLYGIPDIDAHGLKVGIDRHGGVVDPDTFERVVDEQLIESTRSWLAMRLPAMRDAPLVDARVCQYENTSSGDFIIDRHPMWPQCWIVGGGSGHGFKHGPSVGRHVAALVDGTADVHPRFALANKTTAAARAVY